MIRKCEDCNGTGGGLLRCDNCKGYGVERWDEGKERWVPDDERQMRYRLDPEVLRRKRVKMVPFDEPTFLALVQNDEGEYDRYLRHSYLSDCLPYLRVTIDVEPAWMAITQDRQELLAYVYNKKQGKRLTDAIGGEVREEENWRDGKYLIWHRPLEVTVK